MNPNAIMLFAAGFGTRMGALTRDRPKPMIAVNGRPMIDHALDMIAEAGLTRTVVNLHHFGDMIRGHLAGRDVVFSDEGAEILETGGGLKRARPLLGSGPVMTLNPDAIWSGPNPLSLLRQAWDDARMDALLLLIPKSRGHSHAGPGDFVLAPDGRISRGPDHIYSGAQIIRTDKLADFREAAFSLNLLWEALLAEGRVFGLAYPGRWCDVGTPEGVKAATNMLMDDRNV